MLTLAGLRARQRLFRPAGAGFLECDASLHRFLGSAILRCAGNQPRRRSVRCPSALGALDEDSGLYSVFWKENKFNDRRSVTRITMRSKGGLPDRRTSERHRDLIRTGLTAGLAHLIRIGCMATATW